MQKKMAGLAFAVVLQWVLIIAARPQPIQDHAVPEDATGKIHGVVLDSRGARFPGVGVTITHQASQTEFSLRTNSGGEYDFTGLPSGSYTVLLRPPKSGEYKQLKISSVEVLAGKTTALESKMPTCDVCDYLEGRPFVPQPTTGDIAGVVVGEPGAAIAGVDVTLLAKPRSSLERRTRTNAAGEYRFVDLSPDKYEVRLSGKQFCPKTVSAKVVVGKTANMKTRLKTCVAPAA